MSVVDSNGQRVQCENDYWRRNIWGASRQADRLVGLGIAYWHDDAALPGPWPEIPEGAARTADGELWDDETEQWVDPRYRQTILDHVRQTGGERPGIAAYKLVHSNDGWWVTKAECVSALELWEKAGKPDWDLGLNDLEPFLRAAAEHDGFRVW
ncbi:hypothetical protein CH302_19505 [Rhodococcus sp. 15-2388-1-1a]|nr:hypothetical protein CH302_19505 [Rhodococcus sp. 15-2388-1-1a]